MTPPPASGLLLASSRSRHAEEHREIVIPAIAADGSLYPIEKLAAHRQGVLHLAASVFVFSDGELLIQRRAADKYHCGGMWANTCCTHPNWDESPYSSAERRLHEELGVSIPLTPGAIIEYAADVSDHMREWERVHVYRGDTDRRSLTLSLSPREVSETRWASVASLKDDARAQPDLYAPWFRIYLARWDELGL